MDENRCVHTHGTSSNGGAFPKIKLNTFCDRRKVDKIRGWSNLLDYFVDDTRDVRAEHRLDAHDLDMTSNRWSAH